MKAYQELIDCCILENDKKLTEAKRVLLDIKQIALSTNNK